MEFLAGYVLGNNDDGVGGSNIILDIFLFSIVYYLIQDFAVDKMGKYYDILFVSFIFLSILIYRYSNVGKKASRLIIYIGLLPVNLFVCIMLSFNFFERLGHDPLYLIINFLHNNENFITNLIIIPVMVLDIYIRVNFFRIGQKLVLNVIAKLLRTKRIDNYNKEQYEIVNGQSNLQVVDNTDIKMAKVDLNTKEGIKRRYGI